MTSSSVFRALAFSLVALAACSRSDARAANATGEQLAARYCGSCHLLPEPALLDRATWDRWVLPRMARRLGLRGMGWPADQEPEEAGEVGARARAAVYPDSAVITRAEWDRLASYYLEHAPASLPRAATPAVDAALDQFVVRVAPYRVASPMVTLVQIDSAHRRVYVADATPGRATLAALDARGRPVRVDTTPSPVSHLVVTGDTLRLLYMGRLHPSDAALGAAAAPGWRVDSLQRPVFATWADLNRDGREDVVVSEFGNLTGRLTWYEHLADGGARRHVLAPQPGAITTAVRDVDGDGRPDVLALTAQADEGVSLFRQRADGAFARERLLRFPPAYGSTSMQLADVDGDGRDDVVYTNGDAGDYPAPPKPYHGVRVFVGDGRGGYAERFFFPMPGAFKAIARDFDGDGDVDVAAIAFYTDYTSAAPLPFVYLENVGAMRFRAHTFADANRGRWLTMDAGDVDGDGDADLVLGSFAQLDALGDSTGLSARWRRPDAPTVLVLENRGARVDPGARRSSPR